MATIILRGTDKKLETTIKNAQYVNNLKDTNANPKTPLSIEGVSLLLEDIRYAMYDSEKDRELQKEQSGEDSDNYYKNMNSEFLKEINEYMISSRSKKIEFNLKVAGFYCYTFTGLWLKEWSKQNDITLLQKAISDELDTQTLVASPKIYKNIFKKNVDISMGTDNLANTEYMTRQAPLKIMERYLIEVYQVEIMQIKNRKVYPVA